MSKNLSSDLRQSDEIERKAWKEDKVQGVNGSGGMSKIAFWNAGMANN